MGSGSPANLALAVAAIYLYLAASIEFLVEFGRTRADALI